VLYASRWWWTPSIECLPETPPDVVSSQVTNRRSVNGTLTYRKIVDVTPRLNNVQFSCRVSFKSPSHIVSSSDLNVTPADIHLWTSPAVKVKGESELALRAGRFAPPQPPPTIRLRAADALSVTHFFVPLKWLAGILAILVIIICQLFGLDLSVNLDTSI